MDDDLDEVLHFKQQVIAVSSTEAEHIAAIEACNEAIWLACLHSEIAYRKILEDVLISLNKVDTSQNPADVLINCLLKTQCLLTEMLLEGKGPNESPNVHFEFPHNCS